MFTEIITEALMQFAAMVLAALIGVLGTWISAKLAKKTELTNIASATEQAAQAAQLTVMELQQMYVNDWKAARADGKLTDEDKDVLNKLLWERALLKLSTPAKNVLTAAGVDLAALITGAAEAAVNSMKK